MQPSPINTVLFDLDGTLLDTAPDLANALNAVLQEQGRKPLSYEAIRPLVSHGGTAMIQMGFGLAPENPEFEGLRQRLLDIYRQNIAEQTRPFAGILELLDDLEARGINWGVVTNKPAWLTNPLLKALKLYHRAITVVSGDTLPQRKPHPAPMLYACHQAGSETGQCVYIGDAERDIVAGRCADMHTLVALFGYQADDDRPEDWGANGLVKHPGDVLQWIDHLGPSLSPILSPEQT